MKYYDKHTHYCKRIYIIFSLFLLSFNLIAKCSLPSSVGDTICIKQSLDKAKTYNKSNKQSIDSSLFYINKAQTLSDELNCSKYLYEIDEQFMMFFFDTRNYAMALSYAYKIMTSLDGKQYGKSNDVERKRYIDLYSSIAVIYFHLNNAEKALNYLQQAEKLAIKNSETNIDDRFKLSVIYNNLGSVYLQKKEYQIAQLYYKKALFYNEVKDDKEYASAIYNNLGIICIEQKNYIQALEYYNKSLTIREKLNDKNGIAQLYNNMGRCYFEMQEYNKAIDLLKSSLALCSEVRNYRSEIIGVKILSAIYHQRQDYKEEAVMSRRESELKDSILSQESMGHIIQLEAQYAYEKKRDKRELEQKIMLGNKEKSILFFIMITAILSFSFLILILYYRNLKMKQKRDKLESESLVLQHKNLELEKQNLLLTNYRLKQDVETKGKELTTHVMYLVQKNEFIDFATDKLTELINSNSKYINKQKVSSIVKQMRANVDKTSWTDFEIRFQQIHQDFYTNLNEKIPNLTLNEKRLCAFLYLNMTTKEISSITFQSVKSIEVARTRLRKKMQIDRDENLVSALQLI